MKITKVQLRKIIKEELTEMEENFNPGDPSGVKEYIADIKAAVDQVDQSGHPSMLRVEHIQEVMTKLQELMHMINPAL